MKKLFLITLLFIITACASSATPAPLPTPTPVPAPTHTPTVVWFPPTATPTPIPEISPSPTPDLHPGVGELILADDFSSGENWSLVNSVAASASVINNHLTLAQTQPNRPLFTTRTQPVLKDFYAEITAAPKLCAPEDEYGLMVRVKDTLNYFRFGINCRGEAGVDRMLKTIFYPILSKALVPFLPIAVPSQQRLGVWASGQELRFFINGHFLYSVKDNVFGQGTFGVFVRSAGDSGGISADFSDLVIYSIIEE